MTKATYNRCLQVFSITAFLFQIVLMLVALSL